MPDAIGFAEIDWNGHRARIEHEWIEGPAGAPVIVFLHEGLGSRSMWRDFPRELCNAARCRGLVFSRPGYGRSPGATGEPCGVDYLHRQAYEVLPALLDALGLEGERPWLFGHSDGGSIALLFAAKFPGRVRGIVVAAPHIFVEDVTIAGLERARHAYRSTDLRTKLARHHDDPEWVFWSWNDIWLQPAFRHWNIERDIEGIRCPVLAVQGVEDEYATLEQIRGIRRLVPQAQLLELPRCGHSPHRDQAEELIAAAAAFISTR
jgi:pimeloyl-ACP methyl ester carboxylesterase